MKNLQSFGEKAPLKQGPNSVERPGFPGGTTQSFATTAPLNRNAPKADSYGGCPDGTRQSFGEKVKLDRTPRREWDSASTPASTDRSTK
jgi:hypothetical protein